MASIQIIITYTFKNVLYVMKKIILSGGWSYGNLGDEAILISSINLIHQKFPEYVIIVLLYRKNETVKFLEQLDYIVIEQSLHSLMFGVEKKRMDFGDGVLKDLLVPIQRRVNNRLKPFQRKKDLLSFLKSPVTFYKKYDTAYNYFSKLCKDAEIYVMSGGGYLNNWNEMIISKNFEVQIAKQNNLKTYIIGQTVGPFNKYAKQVYSLILDKIDNCFFRDIESIKDTKSTGHACLPYIVPDIALSEETVYEKDNYIVFIPFLTDLNKHIDDIISNIKSIVSESGGKVVITVTQQWAWCIQIATSFYIAMKSDGLDVKLIIPEDYKELEALLSSAEFVFSQNLHGLIMAYRGHTPIVCLNDRRKFVSFMETIGHMENLIAPTQITKTNLYECYKNKESFAFDNCKDFRKQIYDSFSLIINNNV